VALPLFGGIAEALVDGPREVIIRWLPGAVTSTAGGALDYLVYRALAPQEVDLSAAPTAVVRDALEYRATGLTTGSNYRFAVRARDAAGQADCNTKVLEVTPSGPPACVEYSRDVAPILARCQGCHVGASAPQHLRLDSYAAVIAGSVRGNTVQACDAGNSWLALKISEVPPGGARMPRDGPPYLTPYQISLITRWIDQGARQSCAEPSPCADVVPPTFAGLSSLVALDPTVVRACWSEASDAVTASSSLRYDLYEADAPGAENLRGAPQHTITGTSCIDLRAAPGTALCLVARARDLAGNQDANTVERCVTPPSLPAGPDYSVIQPIMDARCTHCHGSEAPRRFLDLSTFEGMIAGGSLGDTVRSCDVNGSLLATKLQTRFCGGVMPLDGPAIAPSERALIHRWIEAGAKKRSSDPSPCGDQSAPTFAGLTTVSSADPSEVRLCWAPGSDAVTPADTLAYDVYEAARAGGQTFSRPPSYAVVGASCLTIPAAPETQSCWVVRARDGSGNRDTNTVERCFTPAPACVDYQSRVQRTFTARCIHCHSGPSAPNGIRWDNYRNATSRQSLVSPCASSQSEVVAITERCAMPRDTTGNRCAITACLTPGQIGLIRGWIDQGANAACPGAERCP